MAMVAENDEKDANNSAIHIYPLSVVLLLLLKAVFFSTGLVTFCCYK